MLLEEQEISREIRDPDPWVNQKEETAMEEEKLRRKTESEEAHQDIVEQEKVDHERDTQLIEARIEGARETLLEVAAKMKELEYESRTIAKITGLSIEEIEKL